jgi:broad specificity phosphatase PhoE
MKNKVFTQAYIIRHGQPDYQLNEKGERVVYGPDINLSQTGIKQIEELAVRMDNLEAIHSSTLPRAMETAQIIIDQKKLDLKIIKEPKLVDMVSNGAIGLPLDEFNKGEVIAKILPGDEIIEEVEKRAVSTFKKIFEEEKGKTFAVVSHGHIIRMIVLRLLEKYQGKIPSNEKIQSYNYLNPGEAWLVRWDENNKLIDYQILARPETKIPGKREI